MDVLSILKYLGIIDDSVNVLGKSLGHNLCQLIVEGDSSCTKAWADGNNYPPWILVSIKIRYEECYWGF